MEGLEAIEELKNQLQELNERIDITQKEIQTTVEESEKCKKECEYKSRVVSLMTDLSHKIKQSKKSENLAKESFKAYLQNNENQADVVLCELESIQASINRNHDSIKQALGQKDMHQKESEELNYLILELKKKKVDLENQLNEEKTKSSILNQELKTLLAQQTDLNNENNRLQYSISDVNQKIKAIPENHKKPQPKIYLKKQNTDTLPSPSFLPKLSVRIDKDCSSNVETEDESIGEQPNKILKTAKLDELKRKKRFLLNENQSLAKEIQVIKNANSSLVVWNESFEDGSKGLLVKYFVISFVACFILLFGLT